ncbi:MAG: hypothetical protein A2X32_01770 [Elusimicrobia bacterium GWC2_64_44]|nr:MAG: hypothetical protein A2X32_01770 [Elusimicrobia bacterium GWC2_64_44]
MKTILVTGPTGYIGGRLIPRLLGRGYAVRCLARHPERLEGRPWAGSVRVIRGDVHTNEGLAGALEGIHAAYYLVHSMADAPGFAEMEAVSARNFAAAAAAAGCGRIIYLGGPGQDDPSLSPHLASRHRVGEILRSTGVPVTEFRAGMIVGSGSVSFELIRYLVERMPLIPACSCLCAHSQPLAVRDALSYLLSCLAKPETAGRIIEIGGSTCHRYRDLLKIYADIRGLKRAFIGLDYWNTSLCSAIIGLLTPIPRIFARPLLDSLHCEATCDISDALRLFPEIKPLDFATAVKYALVRLSENAVETSWTAAYTPSYARAYTFEDREGMISTGHVLDIDAPPAAVFRVFAGLGGERGWLFGQWLWDLKALQDRLVGGIGMRRGRRHPDTVHQGEALDSWRVERVIEGRLLLLRAEMRLPGKGWLQFEAVPRGSASTLRLAAYFEPHGLFGSLYWYSLYPAHAYMFRGLALEIRARAERNQA